MIRLLLLVALIVAGSSDRASAEAIEMVKKRYDVVIYGGTSAAVTAAVQVKKMGKTVVIVSPDKHLGGLTTGGLGWTDTGRKDTIGGLSRGFYQSVKKHYDKPSSWKYEKPEELNVKRRSGMYIKKSDTLWVFEPHIAERIMERMIAENKIPVVRNEWLNRKTGVKKNGKRIVSITTLSGNMYVGKMFIDATYEGDLLAAAGVSYSVGREANAEYNETINGVQTSHHIKGHLFVKPVDPYVVPGDPKSGTVYGVHANDPGKEFEGDHRIQAYNFRMCMTKVKENQVAWPKPADYNEKTYELLFRNFEAGDMRIPHAPGMMPNKKTDTNNNFAFSTDNIGMNYDYPEGSYETRAKIIKQHESYQKGLMWSLANHPRVPEEVRKEISSWGLAKDEFLDNGNWPHQLYIREARRMKSDYVTTEGDCLRLRVAKNSVGLGSYNMDSHNVQRYINKEGKAANEGDIQISTGGAYVIDYKTIVPKKGEAENLFVPVCASSTHIAFGSIRMEPVFMILGQSSATAACYAIDDSVAVQDVDYAKLRKQLLADGQVLDLPKGSKPKLFLKSKKMKGIVIDDNDATYTGDWKISQGAAKFIDHGYHHNLNVANRKTSVTFKANLKPGNYEVRLAYPPNTNRATNVALTIYHAKDEKGVQAHGLSINQKKEPKIDGLFTSLGTYKFNGESKVTIWTLGANGYVVVDAVQFLPVGGK